jgi:hypothetical protein
LDQQGSKLVGTGAVGLAEQGGAVALSGDGNTAIVGGLNDNSEAGTAWVFTRSGGVWTQQGDKLVGTGAVGLAAQGRSVALSGDGNIAVVSGPADNRSIVNPSTAAGAIWIFIRKIDGLWTQRGDKLVGAVGELAPEVDLISLICARLHPPLARPRQVREVSRRSSLARSPSVSTTTFGHRISGRSFET